jgi:hypothetical protein
MAQFDPDSFIEENTKKQTVSGPSAQVDTASSFDADKFISESAGVAAPAGGAAFDPDKFLQAPLAPPETLDVTTQGLQPPDSMLPAFYYGGATGLGQMGRDVAAAARTARVPITQGVTTAAARYMGAQGARPLIDIAALSMGSPIPPVATLETARGVAAGLKDLARGAKEMGDYLSKFPAEAAETLRPAITTFADNLNEAEYAKFKAQADKVGVERAIRDFKIPDRLKNVESFTGAVKQMKEITPPSIARQIAGPLARGALKVAGPVSLAYDVAQAYPYYQAANAPERMASGEVGRQVSQARSAMLSQPTPAPLTPQEAANLLASGDRRTIDIYGGVNKLLETAGNTAAQPETPGFIDRAMNVWRRYQGVPQR